MNQTLYEQLARIGRAAASAPRLMLLDLLSQGPKTVETLSQQTELAFPNVSQHLKVLRQARLVETEKRGLFVTYRLADPQVGDFFRSLRAVAEARLAEVREIAQQLADERDALEPVDSPGLLRRIRKGAVTVLDVRPVEEYLAGHLPGAVSIPLPELRKRVRTLPKGREIVAFCRGPYCVLAPEAVKLLRARGYQATALQSGVGEWRAAGLPLEIGESA
jgi:rhodanese-related sulfurtransferase